MVKQLHYAILKFKIKQNVEYLEFIHTKCNFAIIDGVQILLSFPVSTIFHEHNQSSLQKRQKSGLFSESNPLITKFRRKNVLFILRQIEMCHELDFWL